MEYFEDYQERFTTVITTLGRECRDWADGETDRAVEAIIAEHSSDGDAVVFTDGSVQRGVKSGWAFTIRINGETVAEGSGAVDLTTSSMLMEVKAITEALRYLQLHQHKRALIITDSMSTLQKVLGTIDFWQCSGESHLGFQSGPRRSPGQRAS